MNMSDVKMAVLNARACALRYFGRFACGLAAMALLQLVFLAAGPVTSARAQVVTCATGTTSTSVSRFFIFDADANGGAGGCIDTADINNPGDPTNGFRVNFVPNTANLFVVLDRFESGVNIPAVTAWSVTNYTGAGNTLIPTRTFDDSLPSMGALSVLSFTTTINGIPATISINGVSKLDNDINGLYGLVTVTYTPTTPANKANITDHLLSSFNKVDDGIFGPGGIPIGIANGAGGGEGFAFAPNGGGNVGSGLTFGAQADAINPMNRDYGFFAPGGGYAGLGKSANGKGVNFSFNLQNMIANKRKADEQALGVGGLWDYENKDAPYQPRSRWNAWARGRYTDFDDDSTGADRDGHLWSLTSGLSYALGERTSIGAFTRVRKGEVESKAFDASLDSDFFGGGVFLATSLRNGVRVMGAGLFEGGDNDIVISGDSGSFDSDLFSLEARIDKRFSRGKHWIEPAVKILYSDLDRDGYTDSSGAVIASGGTALGRLTFGPTIGTTIQRGNATIKPFARINGVWDFQNEDDFTLSDGTVVSGSGGGIKLGGGVEMLFGNGVTLNAGGDWFSFNDDLDGVTVTGGIGVPFSALGMGHAGSVSFNLASDGEDASAKARVRIPLGAKD